jgi:HEAT repeat protein
VKVRSLAAAALVAFGAAPLHAQMSPLAPPPSPAPSPTFTMPGPRGVPPRPASSSIPRAPTAAAPPAPKREGLEPTNALRAHFGVDMANRLLHSTDPDDRLRGILRAANVGSPEALAALLQAADPGGMVRVDSRAALALARALAPFAGEKPNARMSLLALVTAPAPSTNVRTMIAQSDDDGDPVLRMELARQTAALALAASGETGALEGLLSVIRTGTTGQQAALSALSAYPSPNLSLVNPALMTPATIQLAVDLGDLRSLDALARAARSMDSATRVAAVVALGKLGDGRALELARGALQDRDPRLRVAAVEALILLEAPNRAWAVRKMVEDDSAIALGIDLAARVDDAEVTRALIGRITRGGGDAELRRSIVFAVGKSRSAEAAAALGAWLGDPSLESDAAHALARAPGDAARAALERALQTPKTRRLALRALVTRALVRNDRSGAAMDAARSMASSRDGTDRAAGTFARLALGEGSLEDALGDRDPRVRRAAAMAKLCDPSSYRTLLRHAARETDGPTKQVLLAGLAAGDPRGEVTTLSLLDRAQAAEADAPLAAMALAERSTSGDDAQVSALLRSDSPLVRAHALRGLAGSQVPSSIGRLAEAYAYETDAMVRRAVIWALASREGDAPSRMETLKLASRLDPDASVRWMASRALAKAPPPQAATPRDVTWIRVVPSSPGSAPPKEMLGSLVRADGIALPIVFDEEGYALVPGVPPGAGRLVLAPRLPAYDAPRP